ncbi:aldehyde dehydrogenase (NADP(+)) [Pseudoduganella sp. R-31]|uniref:aldehyde dehydrogenase (NADP(+)) n=1 Tax=unclassified Pseudoduganella TaxID=2637179 RepID=UPI003CF80748
MQITGEMIIGRQLVRGAAGTLLAFNPATRENLQPPFGQADLTDVERACALAEQAFDAYRATTPEARAAFLEAVASNIDALGATLTERAMAETGLPQARLEGERGRTVNQLRLFAKVVRDGHWQHATLDSALPQRTPPRPDLRLRKIAVGPVAVFGASNFPLAFSVAGGDTASALAAGCPVVVKAHAAHPGTSELVARAVQKAVADCGMPEGVFSMIHGDGRVVGQALVANPSIKAVGFTGSRQGGTALMRTAAARHEPIPVYAEMSSINPVFMLPAVLAANAEALGAAFVESLTMGVGQFCTNPGLVIGVAGPDFDRFAAAAAAALQPKGAGTMLTAGIHKAYESGVGRLSDAAGVKLLALGQQEGAGCAAQAALFRVDAETFVASHALQEEVFGPASVLIACRDEAEMLRLAASLEGQLTATVHCTADDHPLAGRLLPTLERKAGRVLFNGFPTGVEVCHAMVHGGPFPATSDTRTTSVGATAIERFLRPVSYQNVPAALLPAALQDDNPLRLARIVDGELRTAV